MTWYCSWYCPLKSKLFLSKNLRRRFYLASSSFRFDQFKSARTLLAHRFVSFTADLSTLTVSPCVTKFHCLSYGLMVGSSFLTVLQILSGFFPKPTVFLKKQILVAHSNANKEHISSMINKNKTSIRSFLSLSWALLVIMLVKTHIGVPFQWKTQSYLVKTAKNFTTKYNRPHSSK